MDKTHKPILCLDFDGVIHRYDSGWKGATIITDDATEGFFEWLDRAARVFKIVVYSSRSKEPDAITAMQFWMVEQWRKWREEGGEPAIKDGAPFEIEFSDKKPSAFLTIDDRALTFSGNWRDYEPQELINFKPWNKR